VSASVVVGMVLEKVRRAWRWPGWSS